MIVVLFEAVVVDEVDHKALCTSLTTLQMATAGDREEDVVVQIGDSLVVFAATLEVAMLTSPTEDVDAVVAVELLTLLLTTAHRALRYASLTSTRFYSINGCSQLLGDF